MAHRVPHDSLPAAIRAVLELEKEDVENVFGTPNGAFIFAYKKSKRKKVFRPVNEDVYEVENIEGVNG